MIWKTPSTTLRSKTIKQAMFAALAFLTVLTGIASTTDSALARPRLDSFTAGCMSLRDEAGQLRDEYKREGNKGSKANGKRMKQIITELQGLGRTWDELGCRKEFGSMAKDVDGKTGKVYTGPTKVVIVR